MLNPPPKVIKWPSQKGYDVIEQAMNKEQVWAAKIVLWPLLYVG